MLIALSEFSSALRWKFIYNGDFQGSHRDSQIDAHRDPQSSKLEKDARKTVPLQILLEQIELAKFETFYKPETLVSIKQISKLESSLASMVYQAHQQPPSKASEFNSSH